MLVTAVESYTFKSSSFLIYFIYFWKQGPPKAWFPYNNAIFCVQVFSVDMDGSNMQVVLNVSVDYPENLAVDWVNNKLYVVEASVNRIDMVDFDGSNRVTLITENLGNPRGLAVDPTVG